MTRDQTPAHNTISLGKFAKRLASAVGRFMEVSSPLSLGIYIYRHKVQYFSKTNNLLFSKIFNRRPIDFPVKSQIGGSAVEGSQKNKSS